MLKGKALNGTESLPEVILPSLFPAATVARAAVPLGIAAGAMPTTAIATAIMGGLVSGAFGDSAFSTVGPVGALADILACFAATRGAEVLPWLSLMSACAITLTILLRLHEYCIFAPKAVCEGFAESVAFTIGLRQADFAFGLDPKAPVSLRASSSPRGSGSRARPSGPSEAFGSRTL